jgi:hypothetical protein
MAVHLFTSLPSHGTVENFAPQARSKAVRPPTYTPVQSFLGQAANSIYSLEFQLDIVASISVSKKEKKKWQSNTEKCHPR